MLYFRVFLIRLPNNVEHHNTYSHSQDQSVVLWGSPSSFSTYQVKRC